MNNMKNSVALVVEDDDDLRYAICDTLGEEGIEIISAASGHDAIKIIERREVGIVISDVRMDHGSGEELLRNIKSIRPHIPVVLMTAFGSIQSAVDAVKSGASDYIVKPFEDHQIIDVVNRYIIRMRHELPGIVAMDKKMLSVIAVAEKVAQSNVTVLLAGESGSGKEVVARHIHESSNRSKGPYVAINCAAIPENMLEATLFGYEKGAFTGAYQANQGKFEQAEGGTLLLDEVTEMDLSLQAKILRVLQEKEVERLGGKKAIKLDVRMIATTNRDMKEYVKQGRFREDLYYRLNVMPIIIPALRDRRDDILPLANHILKLVAESECKPVPILDEDAAQALAEHSWPGNVRELSNVLQRACVMSSEGKITRDDLGLELTINNDDVGYSNSDDVRLAQLRIVEKIYKEERGDRKKIAQRLGVSERTLRNKIAQLREYGIDP